MHGIGTRLHYISVYELSVSLYLYHDVPISAPCPKAQYHNVEKQTRGRKLRHSTYSGQQVFCCIPYAFCEPIPSLSPLLLYDTFFVIIRTSFSS